jgi:Tat protein secretion system quality control protein TatD with DNase activity
MAPIPFRGKAATSGMVPHVAAKIAEVKKVSISEVYAAARENTKKIYGI